MLLKSVKNANTLLTYGKIYVKRRKEKDIWYCSSLKQHAVTHNRVKKKKRNKNPCFDNFGSKHSWIDLLFPYYNENNSTDSPFNLNNQH